MSSGADERGRGTGRQRSAVVVGAGIGGLVAALLLAAKGIKVVVVERSAVPGGKIRTVSVGGHGIDSGPTVFTMRPAFEAIFAAAGARLEDHLRLTRADILARHSWEDGSTFDLYADIDRSAEAVTEFAGAREAAGYRAFCKRTAEVFRSLDAPFMQNGAPSPLGLARQAGIGGLAALTRIRPFTALWTVAGSYFSDPRLQQLFGRYATYCGSSPFAAPGPLMLIAHVEQMGVWLVEGGMTRIAEALEGLAKQHGARFRYGESVAALDIRNGRVAGVRLGSGEVLSADTVLFNGDPAALASGLFGEPARAALPPWRAEDRSMSALTWSLRAKADGFPLSRHTVFFSDDYRREFSDIFKDGRLPGSPTIYVCAEDRDASDGPPPEGEESLFVLVNAPARADSQPLGDREIAACERQVTARLARAGLTLTGAPEARVMTTPSDFAALYPATGGALYGRASHGWAASFQRPGARTRIKGLYLAGGGVHPGPGIPMAALSGSHAASAILADMASTVSFHPAAMPGGMSMRSAMTD